MHTARFWFYINGGFVKLSIYHVQRLRHMTGGHDEEGYSFTEREFTYHNGVVTIHQYTSARDCDGPLETWVTRTSDINNIQLVKDGECQRKTLGFTLQKSHQRDHYAEAMGY
jgi:hypothetical protein